MNKVDDVIGFAAWNDSRWSGRNLWAWGRVTKRTEKTVSVHEWSRWGGGKFEDRARRRSVHECVFFDSEADARALVNAIADINAREEQTRRQYQEKRRALIEAARAKGGAQ